MYHTYILRDEAGRHYIGRTSNLAERVAQHRRGGTQTTRRMVGELQLVAVSSFSTQHEAAGVEKRLKSWKNPTKAVEFLSQRNSS